MARRCSGPGPHHAADLIPGDGPSKGRCWKHGRWHACLYHGGCPPACPMCSVEETAAAEAAAQKECVAKEERERQETKRESRLFIAEFQGQGHSREAAEALAAKSQRDKPRLGRERQEAEAVAQREKEFAADTGGTCPVCKRHVPISDGIVLFHEDIYNFGAGDTRWSWEPCPGEGKHAWPPRVQYLNQFPKDGRASPGRFV